MVGQMACWSQTWDVCTQPEYDADDEMTEGRKSQVVLLDERRLDIVIQPKLYAGELLDLVASHFNLKEKEYFGLAFQDDTGHNNWLHLDRKVLEHDFPKKSGALVLYFSVRFYIESITYLKDIATIELFFLQAKQAIFKGLIECDSESAFELAACALQATNGDYTDDESARQQLRKLPLLPTSALREHPSIAYCEEQVIEHYTKLAGQSRGSAIVNYMTIVESLPTYGIHYYEVKDKSGLPWLLGLSFKGVSQYDHNDRKTPRRVFAWKQLENLYFRDKKFSIEVHDPKRIVHTLSSFNLYEDAIQEPIEDFDDLSDAISDPTTQVSVSRRTFGPGNVNVYAWFAATPQLTKCIWSMAVNQHQFYLDRKQSKTQLPAVRSMTEIAADLCQSMTSLPSSGPSDGMSRSNSAHSLSKISTNSSKMDILEEQDSSRALKMEYYQTLKARKEALEEKLKEKTELLKALCIKEGELTGVLPAETPLAPGEATPTVRRRVGTEFSLSPKVISSNDQEEEQYLHKLELEYDLQDKITKAAQKLVQDKSVAKTVRKRRKQSYHRAHQKLKELEKKVNEARRYAGLGSIKGVSSVEEPEFVSPVGTPALQRHQHPGMPRQHSAPQVQVFSSPHVEVVEVENRSTGSSSHSSLAGMVPQGGGVSSPSPSADRKYHGSYTPSAVHSTRNQYRTQMYPSYTPPRDQVQYEGPQDGGRNGYPGTPPRTLHQYGNMHQYAGRTAHYDHGHMPAQAHNAYNIQQSRGGYKSADELDEGQSNNHETGYSDDESYNKPKYGSLEGHYRNRQREFAEGRFGSLERNRSSPLLLPELSPSKFGSKRESTCDHKDSVYPYPCEGECMMNSRVQFHIGDQDNHTRDLRSQFQQQIERQEGVPGDHGYQYHGPTSPPRQQEPPHTPQYQPAGPAFFQEQQAVNSVPSTESPNQLMVKKHQGYIEMSKPFEMSDFYKYSERIRKQRAGDNYSVRTSQNFNRTAQGYHPAQYNQNYPYGTRTGQIAQSRSRPGSPYSQGEDCNQHSQDTVSYAGNARTMPGPYMAQPVHGGYAMSHQSQRTIHLQQPKPMTCEPVQDPQKRPPNRCKSEPYVGLKDGLPENQVFQDQSGVAWYTDQAQERTSTLV